MQEFLAGAPRVVVVADCAGSEDTVADLQRFGFDATLVNTAVDAMEAHQDAAVVMVDLDFIEMDGLTLCREIRAVNDVPLVAFASFTALERALTLEAGCDDCVEKPYHSRELAPRLAALLRRARPAAPKATLRAGSLEIDPALREVRVDDRQVPTTRKEFELIQLLASEPDRVFSRAELLERVWRYDSNTAAITSPASRTIDTHISSLRRKLGSSRWIVTIRGVGFRFARNEAPFEDPVA